MKMGSKSNVPGYDEKYSVWFMVDDWTGKNIKVMASELKINPASASVYLGCNDLGG